MASKNDRARQDIPAGLVVCAFGLATAWTAWLRHPVGTTGNMGPGYFPVALGLVLALLGLVVALRGIGAPSHPVPWRKLARPLVFVVGIVVGFGLLITWLGSIIASWLVVFLAGLASEQPDYPGLVLVASLATLVSYLVFNVLLGIPMPAWPRF